MSDLPDNGLRLLVNLRIKLTAAQEEIELLQECNERQYQMIDEMLSHYKELEEELADLDDPSTAYSK